MEANTDMSSRIKECYAVMKNAPLHRWMGACEHNQKNKWNKSVWKWKVSFDRWSQDALWQVFYSTYVTIGVTLSDLQLPLTAIKFRQIQSIQKLRQAFLFLKTKKKRKEKSGDQH